MLISKTQIVIQSENSNCDETQSLRLWIKSETQFWTKLKNLSCDKTQILKLWQHSNTQIETKLILWKSSKSQIVTNSKSQIVTELKHSNCDKNQKLKLQQISQILKGSFSKKILTSWQWMRCNLNSDSQFLRYFTFRTQTHLWSSQRRVQVTYQLLGFITPPPLYLIM